MNLPQQQNSTVYEDTFVRISTRDVTVKGYGLLGRDKTFALADIRKVEGRPLTFWTGKYRIVGTGDFRTWLGADSGRAKRNIMFVVHPVRGWWRAGYSAEHPDRVVDALRQLRVPVRLPAQWND